MELNRHADSESETLFSDGLSQSPGSQGSSSSPDIPASTQSPRLTSSIQKAYYNMKHKKSGRVIIFLHENFEQRLKVKRVTHINTNDLKEYFKKIGFDQCDIKIDLSDSEIHQVLNEAAAEDHTDRDCIVVVVLTHGSRGYLYSKNSYYKPEDLWAPFAADKCQSLADKPKLFFIQASEDAVTNNPDGCKMMTDGSHSNYLPVQSDFLIAYSTAPGCLWGFLKETLSNMFNDNNDLLTSLSIAKPVQQNPTITHTLRRLVKFRKKNHLLESVIMNDSPELGGERLLRTEELVRCESSLLSTLFKLPDENFASTSQYICRFLDLIQKMNDKGELVEDRVMLTALLYGLPKSMPNREKFKGYITRKYPDNAQFQKVLEELRVVSEKEFSDPNQSGYNQSTPLETEKHLADDREDNSDDVTVDDPILQHISEDHKYKMETMENCPIGLALLIAHETFEKESKLEERPSFKKEVSKICETFTGLGFDVRQFLNKSKEEIINFLNYVGKEDHSNINCLAVIVCSHGDSGGMIHADDGMYSVYDLFKPFQAANCSTLAGKPKLFFLGPCRGMKHQTTIKLHDDVPNYDSDMETDMGGRTRIDLAYPKKKKKRVTHELPWPDIEDHFLISFSTIQDHVAFASHQDSMYIKSLYKRLTAQRDIQHILTFANYESALISTPKHAQISQVTSKLRKILVFPSNVKEGGITGYL